MGTSEAPTKTVTVITEYTCPIVVSKDNWLGGATHSDTFSVQQRETDIAVTRTDSTDGWGMDLEFQCCNGNVSYIKHSNTFVLKYIQHGGCYHFTNVTISMPFRITSSEGRRLRIPILPYLPGYCKEHCIHSIMFDCIYILILSNSKHKKQL